MWRIINIVGIIGCVFVGGYVCGTIVEAKSVYPHTYRMKIGEQIIFIINPDGSTECAIR